MPGRQPGSILIGGEAPVQGTAILRRQAEGLRQLGERMRMLAENQSMMLGELRAVLAQPGSLPAAVVRDATEVLQWCQAIQDDLIVETVRAAEGQQAIDLLGLCQDVVHDLAGEIDGRRVLVTGAASHAAWGTAASLGELVRLAIELVAARSAGWCEIHCEVVEEDAMHGICIRGLEGSRTEPSQALVSDFRSVVASCGFEVQPYSASHETGLILRVPPALRGPHVEAD